MRFKELFEEYGLEYTPLVERECDIIKIPSKVEAKLKYITKTELKTIHSDEQTAKELILVILSNFKETYILSQQNGAKDSVKEGFKVLNATVLKQQVRLSSKPSPYAKILKLLTAYGIIEKGRNYSVGIRSNEYRLTDRYFGKGIVNYELKSKALRARNRKMVEDNLRNVLKSEIGYNELMNRDKFTFPTEEEAKEHLIKLSKEGKTNKRGKLLVYLNKRSADKFEDCVFVEDYLTILSYLKEMIIPIVVSENGGGRVITAFNFLPSVLRPLVKFEGEYLEELDYSCLHPNIVQYIYGGANKEMITHDKVADYLGIDRQTAKIEHLSFFNKRWELMYESPLFKYYADNEPMMMQNIYDSKVEHGYKKTSKDCFYFETELMKSVIKEAKKEYIKPTYCFDAIYCKKSDVETVKNIMNKQSEMFGLLTKTN